MDKMLKFLKEEKTMNDKKENLEMKKTFYDIDEAEEFDPAFEYFDFGDEYDDYSIEEDAEDEACDEEFEYKEEDTDSDSEEEKKNDIFEIFDKAKCGVRNRNLRVTYIHGDIRTDKLKCIYDKYDIRNTYRVTNYNVDRGLAFKNYKDQKVMIFDNFNGQIPAKDILCYLQGTPLMLPSVGEDKLARYNRIFVVSYIPLSMQYVKMEFDYLDKTDDCFRDLFDDCLYVDAMGKVTASFGSLD